MIKQKQFAKEYFKVIQKNGSNLSRKRKKEVKRFILYWVKEAMKSGWFKKLDVYMGINLNKY